MNFHFLHKIERKNLMASTVLAVILLTTSSALRDPLARVVWEKYRMAPVAGFLNLHDANLAIALGNYYFNGGAYNLPAAIRWYQATIAISPKIYFTHYQLGRIYFVQGKFQDALDELNTTIELRPDFGKAYYMRGLTRSYHGNLDGAEEDFKHMISLGNLGETGWAAYNDLSFVQFRKGSFMDMVATAETGLREYSDNPWLLNSYGLALLNTDKNREAKYSLIKALDEARGLTTEQVQKAYPGNDPATANDRKTKIITAIEYNLSLAEEE